MTGADGAAIAAAPISWGVCEVPGWGRMLPPERVLAEMAGLGVRATELGAVGYLPQEPAALRALLGEHGLALAAAFVPLVLHEPAADAALAAAEEQAALLAAAGADVFMVAVVTTLDWGPRVTLDDAAWERLARHLGAVRDIVEAHGLTCALHPHVGTLVETAADVERALELTDVAWCLDTGHLFIGGVDPAAFAREHAGRVVHVHLKDVDGDVAARLSAGGLSLMEAVQTGLFRPLGTGDAQVAATLDALTAAGYDGWLVLEQDTAITGDEPPAGEGPVHAVRASLDFVRAHAAAAR
jgi:inosose dehydratase